MYRCGSRVSADRATTRQPDSLHKKEIWAIVPPHMLLTLLILLFGAGAPLLFRHASHRAEVGLALVPALGSAYSATPFRLESHGV